MKIRIATKKDAQQVVEFHNLAFNERRSPNQWLWEHTSDPEGRNIFVVAEEKGKIVGTQAMIPLFLRRQDKLILTGKSESSLVHSSHRGGSLFYDMYGFALEKCEERGIRLIWGFTTATKPFLRLGFNVESGVMTNTVGVANTSNAIRVNIYSDKPVTQKLKRAMSLAALGSFRIIKTFSDIARTSDKIIRTTPLKKGDISNFYERLNLKFPEVTNLDMTMEYRTWRVTKNPYIQYKTYYLYEGDNIVASALVNMKDKNCAYLTEFVSLDVADGKELLRIIMEALQRHGIGTVVFWSNNNNQISKSSIRTLNTIGFLTKKDPMSFVIRPTNSDDHKLSMLSKQCFINGLWTEGTLI